LGGARTVGWERECWLSTKLMNLVIDSMVEKEVDLGGSVVG
jgi:hypothetical protein